MQAASGRIAFGDVLAPVGSAVILVAVEDAVVQVEAGVDRRGAPRLRCRFGIDAVLRKAGAGIGPGQAILEAGCAGSQERTARNPKFPGQVCRLAASTCFSAMTLRPFVRSPSIRLVATTRNCAGPFIGIAYEERGELADRRREPATATAPASAVAPPPSAGAKMVSIARSVTVTSTKRLGAVIVRDKIGR